MEDGVFVTNLLGYVLLREKNPERSHLTIGSGKLLSGRLMSILTGFSSKNGLHTLGAANTFGLADNRAFGCLLFPIMKQGAPAVLIHVTAFEIFPAAFLAHRFDGLSSRGIF